MANVRIGIKILCLISILREHTPRCLYKMKKKKNPLSKAVVRRLLRDSIQQREGSEQPMGPRGKCKTTRGKKLFNKGEFDSSLR